MRPAPSLGIEQADAHNLRGRILQSERSPDAPREYRLSLELFTDLAKTHDAGRRPEFHQRFGDLLMSLASYRRDRQNDDTARRLLYDGVTFYVDLGRRALESVGTAELPSDVTAEVKDVLDNLSRLTPELTERDRAGATRPVQDLQKQFDASVPSR